MAEEQSSYTILVPVGDEVGLKVLLAVAEPWARSKSGRVLVVYVSSDGVAPPWLTVPQPMRDVVSPPEVIESSSISRALLTHIRRVEPDLLLVRWGRAAGRGSYMLGPNLDPLLQAAPCDVAVLRVPEEPEAFLQRMAALRRVLVPAGGGPNATLALQLGLDLHPEAQVTALRVANPNLGPAAISAQWEILKQQVEPWSGQTRLEPHIALTANISEGILDEAAEGYDMVMIGATRESVVDRLIFGNLPQNVATNSTVPVLIIRTRDPFTVATWRRLRWRLFGSLPQLPIEERIEVYRTVRGGARTTRDFYVLIVMSAAIASLGLMLNSTAVIIGAMLVAPLMTALLGISLGIVQGDGSLIRIAARTTLLGAILAVLVSGALGIIVPGSAVTPEMAGRTAPNLLDLGIALGAGMVASYAMARSEVAAALPGVAIAVALVPPLATAGLGLSIADSRVASGALLLFATNLVAIVAAGASTFLWLGFRPNTAQRERRRIFQSGILGIAALLVTIAVLLGALSITTIRRGLVERAVTSHLAAYDEALGGKVAIRDWEISAIDRKHAVLTLRMEATRQVRQFEIDRLQAGLSDRLGRQVEVRSTILQVQQLDAASPGDSF